MSPDSMLTATANSRLPDATRARFADKLYRLDGGHSLANDESVWTPGENVGRSIEFSSTCWLIQRGNEWLLWDTGVPKSALNDPKGWSTLPKLIVYHLDKTLTDQLAAIGLKTIDITYVALSHTHGDHIGNVRLFPDSTVLIQRAEYAWISSPDGPNDNVNQLKALARKLLGTPKHLRLLDGDTDLFGDGSVTLVSTPGRYARQGLIRYARRFELKGFWQLELLTFIRARVELRQHARTDTFNLRRVVRAVTRPFIRRASMRARGRINVAGRPYCNVDAPFDGRWDTPH